MDATGLYQLNGKNAIGAENSVKSFFNWIDNLFLNLFFGRQLKKEAAIQQAFIKTLAEIKADEEYHKREREKIAKRQYAHAGCFFDNYLQTQAQ